MEEVISILQRIKNDSSRTAKEKILSDNKDNKLLRYVLNFLYNPFVLSGLSDKKINKKLDPEVFMSLKDKFHDAKDVMDYLATNNSGRDQDIAVVQYFLGTLSVPSEIDMFKEIFTMSFKTGVTAKTINKAFGEKFIPIFSVQLAKSYFDEQGKVKTEFYVTEKLDGMRILAVKENGKTLFFTRQGQPILELIEIEQDLQLLPDNFVYDGELLLRNDKGLSSDDLFRATQKVARADGPKLNLEFHVFDLLSVSEFYEGKSKVKYKNRRKKLDDILLGRLVQYKTLKYVPVLYYGNDKAELMKLLDQVTANGKEGLMLNLDAFYECKRTSNLLKVKKMQTADLLVVGMEEGSGKNSGKLGALLVDYKGSEVGVGSGFTDELREEIWNNQDKYVGKIAEIQFFEESKNQKDSDAVSLRFPVFKTWRWDKEEPSYY